MQRAPLEVLGCADLAASLEESPKVEAMQAMFSPPPYVYRSVLLA